MAAGILEGIRIVDMSTGIAGPVATMLLAEVGADVVKVEGPTPGSDRALPGFRTWNRSKRSAVVDLDTDAGSAQLETLLAGADVLVHELGPAAARAAGLDDVALAGRHPQLIVSSVLSWPANHPDANLPVDEGLAMARLGILDEQLPWLREGPTYLRFPLGSWGAVYTAATGIVARLVSRWDAPAERGRPTRAWCKERWCRWGCTGRERSSRPRRSQRDSRKRAAARRRRSTNAATASGFT